MGGFAPAVAAIAVALIVAVAARGVPVWTELSDGAGERTQVLDAVLRVGLLGFAAAGAVALVVHYLVIARGPGAPPLRTTLARAAPIAVMAVALLALVVIASIGTPPERRGGGAMQMDWFPGLGLANEPQVAPGAVAETVEEPPGQTSPPADPSARSLLPIILAALALSAVLLVLARRWRRVRRGDAVADALAAAPDEAGGEARERLRERLLGTIEGMLADPDPRTAVIGAYARLLDTLDAGAEGRHPWEGPREHLRRLLTIHRFPGEPSRALVELFEVARYSTHPLTERHRQAALIALRSVLESWSTGSRGLESGNPVGAGARSPSPASAP